MEVSLARTVILPSKTCTFQIRACAHAHYFLEVLGPTLTTSCVVSYELPRLCSKACICEKMTDSLRFCSLFFSRFMMRQQIKLLLYRPGSEKLLSHSVSRACAAVSRCCGSTTMSEEISCFAAGEIVSQSSLLRL